MTIGIFGRRAKQETNLPAIPNWWTGSTPEYYIYWALMHYGLRDGIDFTYQSPEMGGRLDKGGAIIDFYIMATEIGINVQSAYWHYSSTTRRAIEAMQKAQLESYGITMVYIDEEDALVNPVFFTGEALRGIDHSLMVF